MAHRLKETHGQNIHEGRTLTVRLLGCHFTLRA